MAPEPDPPHQKPHHHMTGYEVSRRASPVVLTGIRSCACTANPIDEKRMVVVLTPAPVEHSMVFMRPCPAEVLQAVSAK